MGKKMKDFSEFSQAVSAELEKLRKEAKEAYDKGYKEGRRAVIYSLCCGFCNEVITYESADRIADKIEKFEAMDA